MPDTMIGPPPAQDIQQQRGPFSMGPQQGPGQQPPGQQGPPPSDASDQGQPLEGQLIMVTMGIRQMLKIEPSLAPWANDAIARLQAGVRQLLAQKQQAQGGTMPTESAAPSSAPGGGLPF